MSLFNKLILMKKNIFLTIIICLGLVFLNSCGLGKKLKDLHEPVDLRTSPLDPDERAKRNIKEGKGISLGNFGKTNTNYEFSTSNPLWRASLETIDFMPLATVDYSGGVIISDWYSDSQDQNDAIKITVRFLSNEVRSDSIKIIIHNKICKSSQNCEVNEIDSNIKFELRKSILAKAARLEKENKSSKK